MSRNGPFPLPHFSFAPAAIPLPLKSVIFSCQRERNEKSIQRKRKTEKAQALMCDKENNSHDLYFCNPRPPLTPTPVVITQHVIVIT